MLTHGTPARPPVGRIALADVQVDVVLPPVRVYPCKPAANTEGEVSGIRPGI